jgi:O-antigen/teichoic acid export membrane protein
VSGPGGGVARERRLGRGAQIRRLAGRGAMVNGLFQLSLAVFSGLRGLAAALFVSSRDYGLWGLVGLALWAAVTLRYVGVNDKYVQQDDDDQEAAFQRAFTLELAVTGVAVAVLLALLPVVAVITGHWALVPPGVALALSLPAGALQFPVWAHYRQMDFRRLRTLQATEPLVGSVVTIVAAAAGAGYWCFVAGAVSGAWAGALVAMRRSPYRLAWRFDRGALRDYVAFSGPIAIASLSALAVFGVIYLAGIGPLGLAGLGAFTLAGNLLSFTDRADAIVTEAIYPGLCAVRDQTDVLREAFLKSNRLALMWAVPFGTAVSLFAGDLVHHVLGERWVGAIGLLEVMGVVTAVHHVGFNWHAFYRARGDTRPIAVSAVVVAAVVIASAVPLMYAEGTSGLGYAFLAGEAVGLIVRAGYLRRMFPGLGMAAHMARSLLPTAVVAAGVVGARSLESGMRTPAQAAGELACFVAGAVVLTWFAERPLLREALSYARAGGG